jgi:Carboxypeptidase regulatory-like domain
MCRPEARLCRFFPSLRIALLLLFLMAPSCLLSQTLSGTIQDSSGAVIVGARIEITGGDLNQPLVLSSDAVGKFASPDLKPGTYSLRVTHDGFEPLLKTADL